MISQAGALLSGLLRGRFSSDDVRGQTLVEYGLLLFFVTLVVIAALMLLGPTVSGIFMSVNDQI